MHGAQRVTFLVALAALFVMAGIGVTAVTGAASFQQEADRGAPSLAVFPTVAKLHKNTNLVIAGTGFEPGEELTFLLQDAYGVSSDISGWIAPGKGEFKGEGGTFGVTVNASGSFAGSFPMARFERLGAEGAWGITVMDADYNEVLATGALVFCDPDGRSRAGVYPRKAPNYEKNPDDPRPADYCAPLFEYPERP